MLAAVATLFTACSEFCNNECDHNFIEVNYSNDIVGTWTCIKADFAEALVFNADGTFISIGVANGEYWEYYDATWELKNNQLTLSTENYKSNVLLEIIPSNSLALVDEKGTRNVFNYCTNDLSEEVVGMWVCNDTPTESGSNMAIQTYNADSSTIFTGIVPTTDSYMVNTTTTYKVVGDLMFTKMADRLVTPGTVKYSISRLVYTPNGTGLGDIMTKKFYLSDKGMEVSSWLRIKQSLELADEKYDYSNIYVTNVKGQDKEFEFAGQTLNFSTLDGKIMDKMLKNILFNVNFPDANTISYNCYVNGKVTSIQAPIVVDGNKITIKMSENKAVYRDVDVYAFQDVDACQMHMYMPTTSFEKFFGNISAVSKAKNGELDLDDAAAVAQLYSNVENAIESINVSFIFKSSTRSL